MINGELIVDNFAGGGGENTEYADPDRSDRSTPVCVTQLMNWRMENEYRKSVCNF